jgi:hypothetical protein
MSWLRDRNGSIPNGLSYSVPEVGWTPRRNSSFHGIVESLQRLVAANPILQERYPQSYAQLADLVDQYNANICEQNGWHEYIVAGPGGGPLGSPFPPDGLASSEPPPKSPRLLQKLRDVVGGGETLVDWLASNADAVPNELANSRAAVCAGCSKNAKGDWTTFFTVPVANAIRLAHESRKQMKLSTPYDEVLGVCKVCTCPLRLKVHFKVEDLKVKLGDQTVSQLPEWCWIVRELHAIAGQ